MREGRARRALRALRIDVRDEPVELTASLSRSGVYRVRLGSVGAVLKVTGADEGHEGARRELAFYQTLAREVPVATPRLLAYVDDAELTALVLSAHTPGPAARDWTLSDWLEVARQLAALHGTPPPTDDFWRQPPWLLTVLAAPPIDRVWSYWRRTGAAAPAARALDVTGSLAAAVRAVPECLIHGDCNVDNLLRDGDCIVWADWQGAGVASPVVDLAFLWGTFWNRRERVPPDPPRGAFLVEYAAHRGLAPAPLRRSVIAAELGMTLFGWPGWAGHHGQDEQDRTARRLIELVDDWAQVGSS
jgi:Ser/Thr protein kinase RdoA (MazF antagonist)